MSLNDTFSPSQNSAKQKGKKGEKNCPIIKIYIYSIFFDGSYITLFLEQRGALILFRKTEQLKKKKKTIWGEKKIGYKNKSACWNKRERESKAALSRNVQAVTIAELCVKIAKRKHPKNVFLQYIGLQNKKPHTFSSLPQVTFKCSMNHLPSHAKTWCTTHQINYKAIHFIFRIHQSNLACCCCIRGQS